MPIRGHGRWGEAWQHRSEICGGREGRRGPEEESLGPQPRSERVSSPVESPAVIRQNGQVAVMARTKVTVHSGHYLPVGQPRA